MKRTRIRELAKRILTFSLAIALIVSGLSGLSFPSEAKKADMVTNGSFEDGSESFVGWSGQNEDGSSGNYSRVEKGGTDGAFVRMESYGTFSLSTDPEYWISVESGATYELTYAVRLADEVSVFRAYGVYYSESKGMSTIPYGVIGEEITYTDGWSNVTDSFTVPSDAEYLALRFVLESTDANESVNVTADLDEVSLKKIQDAKAATVVDSKSAQVQTAYEQNEQVLMSAITSATTRKSKAAYAYFCDFEDNATAQADWGTDITCVQDPLDTSNKVGLLDTRSKGITLYSRAIDVTAETKYVLKYAYYIPESETTHISTWWGNWNLLGDHYVKGSWVEETSPAFTIPAGTTSIKLTLQNADTTGLVYVDNVILQEDVPEGDPDNLLNNGYFTNKTSGWTISKTDKASYSVVEESADHGRVLKTQVDADELGQQVYAESTSATVKPTYIYELSYKVKVTPSSKDDLSPYGAIVVLQEFNESGGAVATPLNSLAVNQTNGWKKFTYQYQTSAKATALRVDLMYANIKGTAFWDEIVLKEVGPYQETILDAKYDHGGTEGTKNKNNIISNAQFDGGDATGWNAQEGIKAYKTSNGGGTLQFEVQPGRYMQSTAMPIQGESIYELTYYVLAEQCQNLELLAYTFVNEGEDWRDFVTNTVTKNTNGKWKKVTISFTTGQMKSSDTVVVGFKTLHTQQCIWQTDNSKCDCTSKGTVYLDDISLIRVGEYKDMGEAKTSEDSVIYNGTFNRYAMSETNVDGWDMNVANPNLTATIQDKVSRSGNAIQMVATGHSYIWANDFSVKPGTIYILSYWVKVDKAKGLKFAPYMNDTNYGGSFWMNDSAQPVYEKTDGWVKISGPVLIPETVGDNKNNPDNKIQLGFQFYEGSGTVYLDDVSMVPTKVKASERNMDFELDKNVLYGWTLESYNGGKGTAFTSTDVRPGSKGKTSVKVTCADRNGESLFMGSNIPVKPNTTYELTYWTKQTGDFQGFHTQILKLFQKDGVSESMIDVWEGNSMTFIKSSSMSKYWTYQTRGEVDWYPVSMSFTTAADTHFVKLVLLSKGTNMTTWYDDVSFTPVSNTPNLNFESVSSTTGAPANWYMSKARSYHPVFETDSSVYHDGHRSLHLKKDSLCERVTVDGAAYFPIDSEHTYEFSFWVNSRNCSPDATIRLDMQLYRADGTRIYQKDGNYTLLQGTTFSLNDSKNMSGWQKVLTRSTPPAEAAYATLNFTLTRGTAEVWIDDIFFDVVENATDTVVYYEDFHAVTETGIVGANWQLNKKGADATFTGGSEGGTLKITDGTATISNSMNMLMTDYTYTIKGKYSATMNGSLQLRFYDYMKKEYTEERHEIALSKNKKTFETTVTVPSNSYASFYIGSAKKGTIVLDDITVYMMAKPANSSDWDAFWVWYPEDPVKEAVEEYRYFRYEFTLADEVEYAPLQLTADDKYEIYINGELLAENWDAGSDSWGNVASFDVTKLVKKGRNLIAVKCFNKVSEGGLLFDGKFTLKNQNVVVVASNSKVVSSKTANDQTLDWTKLNYDDSSWKQTKEWGTPPCSPWGPVYYNSQLYINNAATVISTKVPEKVISGKTLDFEVTLKLDSPIEAKFSPVVTIYKRNSLTSVTATPMNLKNYDNPLKWPVGEEFTIQASITIPDYVETGKYELQMASNMLLLSGEEVYDNKFISFAAQATGTGRDPIESKIEVINGTPTLTIDGEPQASHFYCRPDLNVYLQGDSESRLYKSDLELYITYGGSLYKGGCDPIWLEDGSIDYDVFDSVIYDTLGSNSDALVMVHIGMFAPTWWMEQNPDHVVLSDNGSGYVKSDDVSFASEKFRKEAGEVLRQLIRHMKEQSYFNRVYGLKISAGHTYEWMTWGTGDGMAPDYSKVSIEGFRKYLKKTYKTEEALQKAWGVSGVTFENASEPSWNEKSASTNVYMGSVQGGSFSRATVDWNLYLNDVSADSFLYYAQIAKEETDNKLIVGGYNGYLWTYNAYDSHGKAHTAFRRILQSDLVDWVASPIAYNERLLGESDTYMAMIDAIQEYGKIYIAEQDNRTCLSNVYAGASWDASWDFQVGQTRTLSETVLQQKRDFANAMINGVGLWQFDMYGGWLDDDQIYDYLADAKAEYDFSVYVDRDQRNEVAVFVGDESYAYMGANHNAYTVNEPMLMQQRKHLSAMGAGYDTYNMSALLDGKVSPHKVNILLSPTEITDEMQKAIDKYLKVNDQYVIWVYMPGISDGTQYDLANMKEATGFDIAVEERIAGLQVKLTNKNSLFTNGIEGLIYGESQTELTSPLTYVTNTAGATVLGHNMDGGGAGLVLKDMGDWTSIYSSAPCLDAALLRNILEVAGCHIYSDNAADVIYNNNHYVALHSATSEKKAIKLPKNYSVYDVFEEKFISMDTDEFTYKHEANDTHIFRLLTPNTYAVTARLKSGKGTLSAPGLTEVSAGEAYELKVTPEDGYEVSTITVNDEVVELKNNTFTVDDIDQNYVIHVRFDKLPEMEEVIMIVEELIILPWWAFFLIVAGLTVAGMGINRVVKDYKKKKELEEGGM